MNIKIVTAVFVATTCMAWSQTAANFAVEFYPSYDATSKLWRLHLGKSTASDTSLVAFFKGHGETDWLPLRLTFATPLDSTATVEMRCRVCDVHLSVVRRVSGFAVPADGYARIIQADTAITANGERVAIVIDAEAAAALEPEIMRYRDDLRREGWTTQLIVIPAPNVATRPPAVRQRIREAFHAANPSALTHVVLVGAVPNATSGGFKSGSRFEPPDGHIDHGGAWSSDAYYADLDISPGVDAAELWTDTDVNISDTVNALRPINRNIPGDGKFDQSVIPSDVEIAIGRIDMRDLPAFGSVPGNSRSVEFELLQRYFNKNHRYRTNGSAIPLRAIIDDNFGAFSYELNGQRVSEAFAASAWRSFAPIVPTALAGDWVPDTTGRTSLDTAAFLLAYGCGGGGFEHCTYVATTQELAAGTLRAPFTLLFGSYFADASATNNLMRAVIAADGNALTCGWSGRPHWFLHPMAAGATIGECLVIAQNNDGTYRGASQVSLADGTIAPFTLGQRNIHIQLVGDPTLRLPGPRADTIMLLGTAKPGDQALEIMWRAGMDDAAFVVDAADTEDGPWTAVYRGELSRGLETTVTLVNVTVRQYLRCRPVARTLQRSGRVWCNVPGRGTIFNLGPVSHVEELTTETDSGRFYCDVLGRVIAFGAKPSAPGLYFWRTAKSAGTLVVR